MGKMHHEIDPSQPLTCSSCHRKPESATHLHRCSSRRAAMEDAFLQRALQSFLEDNFTCPRLACTLLEALYSDIDDSRYPQFANRHGANDPKCRQLHQLQAHAGWAQLFQRQLVKEPTSNPTANTTQEQSGHAN